MSDLRAEFMEEAQDSRPLEGMRMAAGMGGRGGFAGALQKHAEEEGTGRKWLKRVGKVMLAPVMLSYMLPSGIPGQHANLNAQPAVETSAACAACKAMEPSLFFDIAEVLGAKEVQAASLNGLLKGVNAMPAAAAKPADNDPTTKTENWSGVDPYGVHVKVTINDLGNGLCERVIEQPNGITIVQKFNRVPAAAQQPAPGMADSLAPGAESYGLDMLAGQVAPGKFSTEVGQVMRGLHGMRYQMGGIGRGNIDCSGLVSLALRGFVGDKRLSAYVFGTGRGHDMTAASIIQRSEKVAGHLYANKDVNAQMLKPGMVIGIATNKKTSHVAGEGRYRNIDHIVFTYMNENGHLMVGEATRSVGVHSMSAERWLQRYKSKAGYDIYAVNVGGMLSQDQSPEAMQAMQQRMDSGQHHAAAPRAPKAPGSAGGGAAAPAGGAGHAGGHGGNAGHAGGAPDAGELDAEPQIELAMVQDFGDEGIPDLPSDFIDEESEKDNAKAAEVYAQTHQQAPDAQPAPAAGQQAPAAGTAPQTDAGPKAAGGSMSAADAVMLGAEIGGHVPSFAQAGKKAADPAPAAASPVQKAEVKDVSPAPKSGFLKDSFAPPSQQAAPQASQAAAKAAPRTLPILQKRAEEAKAQQAQAAAQSRQAVQAGPADKAPQASQAAAKAAPRTLPILQKRAEEAKAQQSQAAAAQNRQAVQVGSADKAPQASQAAAKAAPRTLPILQKRAEEAKARQAQMAAQEPSAADLPLFAEMKAAAERGDGRLARPNDLKQKSAPKAPAPTAQKADPAVGRDASPDVFFGMDDALAGAAAKTMQKKAQVSRASYAPSW